MMKSKIILVLSLVLIAGVSWCQDPEKEELSPFEKMLMKKLFKPFDLALPPSVFDLQEEAYNMRTYKSSKYSDAAVVASCSMFVEDFEFVQEKEEDKFLKASFKYGKFSHTSGVEGRYLSATQKPGENKICHFILDYQKSTFSIVLNCKVGDFSTLFGVVKKGAARVERKK